MPSQPADGMETGIEGERLRQPMKFKEIDGSIVGDLPTCYLTEPVHLSLGNQEETIRFVVAPKMAEVMILGLCWLTKWSPSCIGKNMRDM